MHRMNPMASVKGHSHCAPYGAAKCDIKQQIMLSAAIKRQDSSMLSLLSFSQFLTNMCYRNVKTD